MIHRFLEDLLLLLSTIKDDDHLAAYRVSKPAKSTTYLQFVHRFEEIGSSNSSSEKVWKPYGIPLVAPVLRNVLVRNSDIEKIVHVMRSPMIRSEELPPSVLSCTLSPASEAHQDTGTNKAFRNSSEDDIENKESENLKPAIPSLSLHLADDDDKCIDLSSEKSLRLSLSSFVFINWSKKDLKKYDTRIWRIYQKCSKYAPAPKRARGEPLSLYACLDAFLREELLVPEDMWFCSRCKEQSQASKNLDLWRRLPEVLVIHLSNSVAHKRGPERQLYEPLCSHYGSMASGHYTAHIKFLEENKWYNFDNSHITPMNEDYVRSSAAYVLFYRRVKEEEDSPNHGAQLYGK